jgi:outer membrane protein
MSWTSYNNFSASETINQLIWDFDLTPARWHASRVQARAQVENERAVSQGVTLAVRSAFYQARAGKALVGVAKETLENLKKHLDQSQGFVQAGTRPEIDLAQARTNLAVGQAQLVNAENGYLTSKAVLNQAMGVILGDDYEVADEAPGPVEGEDSGLEPLAAEAIKSRAEIAVLERQLEAQKLLVHAAKGGYWPSFSGNLGSTQGGTTLTDLGWNISVGLSMNWALFQGGLTAAQVHEAEALADQLAAQLELSRQQVRFDVEQARLAVRAAKASLVAQNDAVLNAREQLRLAEGRYQTGVGNGIELSDAQVALTNAEAQVIQSDEQLAIARAQLLRALGR